MSNAYFFSVIIPTYNRGYLILDTINSVLLQKYKDFELIIVDDGSTDNTEELIKEKYSHLSNVKYIKQNNAERGAARNNGLKNASGKYINYFDSDDIMFDNHLSTAFDIICKYNNPAIFNLNYIFEDKPGRAGKPREFKEKIANKPLIRGNYLPPNCVIIRKDIALKNQFVEDRSQAALMEDWELWLRIACKHEIFSINVVTSLLKSHDNRSVISTDIDKLIQNVTALKTLVVNNNDIVAYYKPDINKFVSSCYTYISLHIVLTKKYKLKAVKYLIKGLFAYPGFVTEKRFFSIIKRLVAA